MNIRQIHATAAVTAFLLIALFWISTVISEVFFSHQVVLLVKKVIVFAVFLLIVAMATTGATGFKMAGKSPNPTIVAKRRRMPMIAANGLLILLPCAFFLYFKAAAGQFDGVFYAIQAVELVAGATNLFLMFKSMQDAKNIHEK
ncbi:MAG: hypothetical protein IJ881_10390 [Neisseriaceae bacterium]|nr:hypothetical protein [Neisseriaceae bacterium]MBR3424804.1 hypothetical protein [Neisseriaceae bacterium]